jgi:hypothetical protein
MTMEPYGSTYLHLYHRVDHSVQVGLVTTPTTDVGPLSVEEGRTKPLSPHILAACNSKINREASSIAGCDSPLLNQLTRTIRNIPLIPVHRYGLLWTMTSVNGVGLCYLKTLLRSIVTTAFLSSVKALLIFTGTLV